MIVKDDTIITDPCYIIKDDIDYHEDVCDDDYN